MHGKILVAVASKYGATAAIARAIGETLSGRGFETRVEEIDGSGEIQGWDAVIIGSAVYSGRWLNSAIHFVLANRRELAARPVWLFSSGPISVTMPEEDPVDVSRLRRQTNAQGHKVFAGKLDRQRLNFAERAIVTGLRALEGDYRNWAAIQDWANSIADELEGRETTSQASEVQRSAAR